MIWHGFFGSSAPKWKPPKGKLKPRNNESKALPDDAIREYYDKNKAAIDKGFFDYIEQIQAGK